MDLSDYPRFLIGGMIGFFLGLGLSCINLKLGLSVLYSCTGIGLLCDLPRLKRWMVSRVERKSGEEQEKDNIDEYHI